MTAPAREAQFVGLDVGTQSTKGLVVDAREQRVVARAQQSYGLIEGLPPGAAEQHPATWWEAVRAVVRELLEAPGVERARLAGLGVSGQQHGLVALDRDGAVIRPAKLWCDTTTAGEARELGERWGRNVPAGFTAPKVLWLRRHEPEAFARLHTMLLPHDWINYRLTGRLCAEAGDASGTGFFDPRRRCFAADEAASIDPRLPEALPELLAPDEPVGLLTAAAAAELGLPAEVLVAPGGGDNMMSAIGSGATRPGICVLSLGTSGTAFAHSSEPVIDPEGLIAPFCDSTGGWLPLLCVMNATGVTGEVHAAFAGSYPDIGELTRAAEGVAPGCGGVLLLPYLQGERVPDLPDATGTLLGLRHGWLDPALLFRAAIEGTSLGLGWGVERMRALGIAIDGVRLVGGGAHNRLWLHVLAQVLDAPVQRLVESESAALGGALQAIWVARRREGEDVAIGQVAAPPLVSLDENVAEPDPDSAATYRALSERFQAEARRAYGV